LAYGVKINNLRLPLAISVKACLTQLSSWSKIVSPFALVAKLFSTLAIFASSIPSPKILVIAVSCSTRVGFCEL